MTSDPLNPTPVADRCGECGLPLWPVGTGVYCANTACSMYARESTGANETVPAWDFSDAVRERAAWHEQRDKELGPPRVVRTLHHEVVTHDAKPARTVWEK